MFQYRPLIDWLQARQSASVEDKLRLDGWFRSKGFPPPRLLAHNDGTTFWVGRVERKIDGLRAFTSLIHELRPLSSNGSIFVKPADGWKGQACGRIDAADADFAALYEKTRTIRMLTCSPAGEPPAVVAALLRLGARASWTMQPGRHLRGDQPGDRAAARSGPQVLQA
jgi:hypothetical protein